MQHELLEILLAGGLTGHLPHKRMLAADGQRWRSEDQGPRALSLRVVFCVFFFLEYASLILPRFQKLGPRGLCAWLREGQ